MSWFWRIFFPENLSVLYPVPEKRSHKFEYDR